MSAPLPAAVPAARRAARWPRLRPLELRWRLSLLIGLLLTLALAAAALFAVHNARVAVAREVGAGLHTASVSLDLTLDLLRAAPSASQPAAVLARWVEAHADARHLCAMLHGAASRCPQRHAAAEGVPAWFARGAEFDMPTIVRDLRASDGGRLRVELRADPRDELREAWVGVRGLLLLIGALAFAVNLGVFLAISRGLEPLRALMQAMDRIGRGQAAEALPRAGPPEIRALSDGLQQLATRITRGREQVRALHLRNLELQEDERRMVARELHDEIGQHVAAIEMETIRLSRIAPHDQAQRDARLQQLRASIAEIHRVSRRLVQRLRPPSIETLGPCGAIEALIGRWCAEHPEPAVEALVDPGCDALAPDRAVHLYRVVQESLSNVARHACARQVALRIGIDRGDATVRVGDDGRGFDPAAVSTGYGLAGMRERVAALSGHLEVRSRPGAGTVIEARFPLR